MHSVIGNFPSAFYHPRFITRIFPSAFFYPPSAIRHPPSAIRHPPSAIRRHTVGTLQRLFEECHSELCGVFGIPRNGIFFH